jgi:hypothetical protein
MKQIELLALARSERATTCQRQARDLLVLGGVSFGGGMHHCKSAASGMHAADARLRARVAGSQLSLPLSLSLSLCTLAGLP